MFDEAMMNEEELQQGRCAPRIGPSGLVHVVPCHPLDRSTRIPPPELPVNVHLRSPQPVPMQVPVREPRIAHMQAGDAHIQEAMINQAWQHKAQEYQAREAAKEQLEAEQQRLYRILRITYIKPNSANRSFKRRSSAGHNRLEQIGKS